MLLVIAIVDVKAGHWSVFISTKASAKKDELLFADIFYELVSILSLDDSLIKSKVLILLILVFLLKALKILDYLLCIPFHK